MRGSAPFQQSAVSIFLLAFWNCVLRAMMSVGGGSGRSTRRALPVSALLTRWVQLEAECRRPAFAKRAACLARDETAAGCKKRAVC